MNSFKNIIGASADALRETRVKNVVHNTEAASRNRVETAKQSFRDMQSSTESACNETNYHTNSGGHSGHHCFICLHSIYGFN